MNRLGYKLLYLYLYPRSFIVRGVRGICRLWDALDDVDIAAFLGVSEIILAFIMVIVHYETLINENASLIQHNYIPWFIIPFTFLIFGILLLRPIKSVGLKIFLSFPVFLYGIMVLFGAFSERTVTDVLQVGIIVILFWLSFLITLRKSLTEHRRVQQILSLNARLSQLEQSRHMEGAR